MPSAPGDFEGGIQKRLLRTRWDLPIINSFRVDVGRQLRYFGMPGPAIEDIKDWPDVLGHVTAVELLRPHSKDKEDDLDRLSRLNNSLLQQGVDYQLLRGWVEDVIISGYDTDRQAPQYRDESDPALTRFRYDLINLDFCGGAGYGKTSSTGKPKRIRALQELFRRQQGIPFLLLLTINVRDQIDDGLTEFITDLRNRVESPLQAVLDWYAGCGNGMKKYRLKAAIPPFLQHVAEDECFDVECLPPIAYLGSASATMVHFVLRCVPTTSQLHSVSVQSLGDLIRLPLLTCTDESVEFADIQHEGFDWKHCYDKLSSIPPEFLSGLRAVALTRIKGNAA